MKTITFISQLMIPAFILFTVLYGACKKVRVYDSFVAGAKEGIQVTHKYLPLSARHFYRGQGISGIRSF